MNPRRKQRLYAAIAMLLGFFTITGLILFYMSVNIDLFFTPTEIIDGRKKDGLKPEIGQRLRIGGLVKVGTVQRNKETLDVSFELMDVGPAVTVVYQGILPDLFREGQGIVAQGHLVGPRKIKAFEVLAKHDENYMPEEVADALKAKGHFKGEYGKDKE